MGLKANQRFFTYHFGTFETINYWNLSKGCKPQWVGITQQLKIKCTIYTCLTYVSWSWQLRLKCGNLNTCTCINSIGWPLSETSCSIKPTKLLLLNGQSIKIKVFGDCVAKIKVIKGGVLKLKYMYLMFKVSLGGLLMIGHAFSNLHCKKITKLPHTPL